MLTTTDETRPLGVVRGGEAGRRLADSSVLPEIRRARRRRSRSRRAASRGRARGRARVRVRRASSSARRSASTRLCRIRSPTRTPASSSSRSLALWAAWCVATGDAQAPIAAAAAKVLRRRERRARVRDAIQSLGGIGFTWEHRLHRLYKRALGIESFGASGTRLRAEIAASLPTPLRRSPTRARHRCRTRGGVRLDGLMMDYQLNAADDPPPSRELFARERDRLAAARQELAPLHVRRLRLADEEARRRAPRARARGRRPRRNVHVEPLAAPRDVHRASPWAASSRTR